MSRSTPGTIARELGFTPLPDGSFFKAVPSLYDKSPVGLVLSIARSRLPGQYRYSLTTDGGATRAHGTGIAGDIEGSIVTALILHEAHELRKEVPD